MQTKQPDITRDKVLEAAFCEIHRRGFQAASIANILASTGLTKGALYHHFPTKQALGLAVVDEVIYRRLDERFFTPLRQSQQPLETLLSILDNIAERANELVTLGCPLNNLIQEMSPLDPAFKERLGIVLHAWRDAVEGALQRAQEQQILRADVDCAAAALFIVSAWEGCIGIAKNLQSADALALCSRQLQAYIRSLRTA
ncbi:MAG: TetR/AcrR family transcriptional regulator [Sulfuricella sp.]|nr:TetR/AcrR family transcriptional regulator [Sulfuricella sp.]